MTNPNLNAAIEYLRRKVGGYHPQGRLDKGKWHPLADEKQTCCSSIRSPSLTYPWTLYIHCFSLKHVCNMHKANITEVKYILSKKGLPNLLASNDPVVRTYLEKKLGTEPGFYHRPRT